jgi:hypothetical protein
MQPGPVIMTAPAAPPELGPLYSKLQSLFPGWKGQPPKSSPGPQRAPSAPQAPHSTMMQPPNSAGLPPNALQQQSPTPTQNVTV